MELDTSAYDCVAIVTDHSTIDYEAIARSGTIVVDLRNATGKTGTECETVWKL